MLRAARGSATGRLVVVFGAGGDRDRAKRPLMGRVVAELADRAILTSDNPRSEDPAAIAAEVAAGALGRLEVELDRRAAIELALGEARPGDVVVIAGRGAEPEQELRDRARSRSTTGTSPARCPAPGGRRVVIPLELDADRAARPAAARGRGRAR